MKTFSKEEKKKIADEVFVSYPNSQKVIVAGDGQAFIADESDLPAKNHAKNNRYKKELELTTFLRPAEKTEQKAAKSKKEQS
jgi:hypothetical protein